jgi:hypothetical protein
MGWWTSGERFHKVAAYFRNLSSGGALIVTRETPPHEYVWIGLTKFGATQWCPVRVVTVMEHSVGLIEVGLAFKAAFDFDLFKDQVERGVPDLDTLCRCQGLGQFGHALKTTSHFRLDFLAMSSFTY